MIALVATTALVLATAYSGKPHTVIFMDEDGTVIEEAQTHVNSRGTEYVECPSITKDGSVLKTWELQPSDTNAAPSSHNDFVFNVSCNLEAKAVWEEAGPDETEGTKPVESEKPKPAESEKPKTESTDDLSSESAEADAS